MSYQVLARKWRPRTFSEMVGQEHVLQALINGLDNDRLHHAYLFTGTRGVGKTTLARIIAKCLNCEQGVSSSPCGECSACVAINEGRFVDLLEVDAASKTKVEDTREMLDNVQYLPTSGRYKVYLIDEVHMLSNHSFNALLKTLEEPPPHVKFLLATTDPQKLPVTILSRCLQFNLKNLNPERIVGHLQQVLTKEQVPFEEPALWALGRAADGSMRDALSLTDQAIAHGDGKILEADVNAMLGAIDLSSIENICLAIANNETDLALSLVNNLAEHSPDYSDALATMLSLWHRAAIGQIAPDALDHSHADHKTVLQLASAVSREDIQLFYQITLLGRRDLPYAADPRSGFEMVLLRLLAFQPGSTDYAEKPKIDIQAEPEGAVPVKKSEILQPSEALQKKSSTPVENSVTDTQALVAVEPLPESQPETLQTNDNSVDTEPAFDDVPAEQEEPSKSNVDQPLSKQFMAEQPLTEQATTPIEEPVAKNITSITSRTETLEAPIQEEESLQTEAEYQQQITAIASESIIEEEVSETDIAAKNAEHHLQASISLNDLMPNNWIEVYLGLSVGGLLQNTASNLIFIGRDKNQLQFEMERANSSLYKESLQERLALVLSEYFGSAVDVGIIIADVKTETPRKYLQRLKAERLQLAVETLQQDPQVTSMIAAFNGELLEHTIRPIDES